MKSLRKILAVLGVLVLSGCVTITITSGKDQPAQPVAAISAPAGSVSAAVGTILNRERTRRGLAPLYYSAKLAASAQAHANDMVRRGYFAHRSPAGTSAKGRARRRGYKACLIAENIAQGQRSAAEVMAGWMGSPPHRANNLLPNVAQFGVGLAGTTWVLVLANPGC